MMTLFNLTTSTLNNRIATTLGGFYFYDFVEKSVKIECSLTPSFAGEQLIYATIYTYYTVVVTHL